MLLDKRFFLPFGFFLFISYIIFLADTADYNFAFRVIGHIPYGDKIMHAVLYGVMAGLLNWGLGYRSVWTWYVGCCPPTTPLQHPITQKANQPQRCCEGTTPYEWGIQWGAVIVLAFAAIEECTQYYIPSRTFDLGDLAADLFGVILFSLWRIK